MRGTLPLLREKGFEVSSLHPFRDSWYRRFGFIGIGMRFQIRCPADRLPHVHAEMPVVEIPADHRHLLDPVCAHTARVYNGYNVRSPDQWWRTLGGDTPMAIYVCGDPVEAYAVVRLKGDFWVDQDVKEFLWTTDRGYRTMLAFFRSLAMNKSAVTWTEPGDSPYVERYYERGVNVELLDPVMYRRLDIDDDVAEQTREWLGDPKRVYCTDAF